MSVTNATPTETSRALDYRPEDIGRLLDEFLALTAGRDDDAVMRDARDDAKRLRKRCHTPRYLASLDARWDLDWVIDLLDEVVSEPVEEDPEPEWTAADRAEYIAEMRAEEEAAGLVA